jgi:surface protein
MELVAIVGILAIFIAILTPSLLNYIERTRMERDESTMSELVNSVSLAIADQYTFDEVAYYSAVNNFITYTDSSGAYGSQETDSEYWSPDGSGKATTITFNPTDFNSGKYVIANAYVNDMTYDNGSTAGTRLMIGCAAENSQVKFDEMKSGNGVTTAYLCRAVQQTMGQFVQLESSTYANSSYTVFILFGTNAANENYVSVKGSFNGTNLTLDSPAAFGSETDSYDDTGKAEGTQSGKGEASFNGSAMTGSGTVSYQNYKICESALDKGKFWDFCNTLTDVPVEAISFSANGSPGESMDIVDISVNGDGSICAWYNNGVVYICPEKSGHIVALPEDSSYLFDSTKTNLVGLKQIHVACCVTTNVIDMTNLFANNVQVVNISGLQNWDTSNVVSVGGMFRSDTALQMVRVEHLRLPVCEDMSYMFYQCSQIDAVATTDWNMQVVKDLSYAFYECNSIKELDIGKFNTVALTNLAHAFDGCTNVAEFNLSEWDVSSVTSFNSTFKDCKSADIINIEGWETTSATDMGSMFENCRALLALDTAKFTTENVINFSKMFYNCVNLSNLDIGTFNTLKATNMSNMFDGMLRLTEIQIGASFSFFGKGITRCCLPTPTNKYISGANGSWTDASGKAWKPENIPNRTAGIYVAIETSLPAVLAPRNTWWRGNTDPSTITALVFANSSGIPRVYQECFNADVGNVGEIKVYVNGRYAYVINCKNARSTGGILLSNDASRMFADFTSLTSLTGLRVLNTINVNEADNMFGSMSGSGVVGCTKLSFADGLTSWNVQNVKSAKNMFTGIGIKDLDLSKFSFNSLTDMSSMFQGTSIEELNLSGWDVSGVTSFDSMFADSRKLESLTIKGWNNTTARMDSMYANCIDLTTILVSGEIRPAVANQTMFTGCTKIRGGFGTSYNGTGSQYAVADSDLENGYYTQFTASGTLSVKLYDTGTVSGSYTLLTADGATASDWDYSKGSRLLEITLSGMPKGVEKKVTVTVPTGMYIEKNSWTTENNDISAVKFEQLMDQGTGIYVNQQTGTLTYTIAPYAQNATITMSVMFDTTLWDKNKANASAYGKDSMTLEDPIVVSLNDGDRVRKIGKIRSAANFGPNTHGYVLANHDSNANIFLESPSKANRSCIAFSTGSTALIQYYKSVDYYVYAYSKDASGNIIYADVTYPTSGTYIAYQWADMSFELLDKHLISTYTKTCKVSGTMNAENVLHMSMSEVYSGNNFYFTLPSFTVSRSKGFLPGRQLTVVCVAEVETFNGQTKKMSTTKNYTIKSEELDYQTDLVLTSGGESAPAESYFGTSGYGNLLGKMAMRWGGAQDLVGMTVKYEYDTNTTSGEPNVKVHAARVCLPSGSSTDAKITLVDNSGNITREYTVKITSKGDSSGAYVSAANIASTNGLSGTYYLKTIYYTMPKVTGSTTSIHYLYASSSSSSLSSAGVFMGTIRSGSGKSTLTVNFPDGTSKTTSRTTSVVNTIAYSGTINDVALPSGTTITAGNNFEMDVQLYAISYPYSNTQLFKNPELYVVLPQGVSIEGVIIGDSKTTATSKANAKVDLVKTTTIDGVLQNIYKVSFEQDVWFGYAKAGKSGIGSVGVDNQWVRLMCSTDSSMSNTSIRLINSLWFKDANGHISISGSWSYGIKHDTYDVDGDGSTSDKFGVAGSSTLADLTITIIPQ